MRYRRADVPHGGDGRCLGVVGHGLPGCPAINFIASLRPATAAVTWLIGLFVTMHYRGMVAPAILSAGTRRPTCYVAGFPPPQTDRSPHATDDARHGAQKTSWR